MDERDPRTGTALQTPRWWLRRRDAEAFELAKAHLRTPMTVLALVFTIGLALEFSQELPRWAETATTVSNTVIWAAFAVEYLWLLRLAPDRGRFVRTHLLDLFIVLLPMLRPLRALRVLRLVAVAARSWRQVFSVLQHRGLGKIISAVGALMLVGGLITFALEPTTFTTVGDAVWWVLVTSTTVGYGDLAPVGLPARFVAVLVMILGIGLVGVITANIVDFMMTGETTASTAPEPTVGCSTCQESLERLAAIEVRLDRLLARQDEVHLPPAPDGAGP